MAEFTKDRYGVDVLKVEVPINMKFVEGAKSFGGQKAYTRKEAMQLFLDAATAATKPFIYLSAGVSNAEFNESLALAAESGVKFNGVLCGRATWKDGIPIYASKGVQAFRDWLQVRWREEHRKRQQEPSGRNVVVLALRRGERGRAVKRSGTPIRTCRGPLKPSPSRPVFLSMAYREVRLFCFGCNLQPAYPFRATAKRSSPGPRGPAPPVCRHQYCACQKSPGAIQSRHTEIMHHSRNRRDKREILNEHHRSPGFCEIAFRGRWRHDIGGASQSWRKKKGGRQGLR